MNIRDPRQKLVHVYTYNFFSFEVDVQKLERMLLLSRETSCQIFRSVAQKKKYILTI